MGQLDVRGRGQGSQAHQRVLDHLLCEAGELQGQFCFELSSFNEFLQAKPVRPDSEGRRIIGNTSEPMDGVTTYDNVFASHAYSGKAAPYRPNENGIIYEAGPASSMTTTHDRTFTTDSFPAKRNIPRNEPETDKVPKSTMKQDFDYKQATEKVMPYLPPGLSNF